ncbi:glucosaminidase domain-containing protein [Pleionea sp. CnH1-48]|uniref:glucosaminidase domain-containing protein n=1 Tax=Pleionea sp. CnH1-48 TaxID=2954494 RepID=UPI0020982E19|nr:glucosaminidase domain-containing protein [Pleionea sp. CnH1-48]MCO7223960.1 glucosaminidase domain-containing protein [Pleionea sp. CnH1-48]
MHQYGKESKDTNKLMVISLLVTSALIYLFIWPQQKSDSTTKEGNESRSLASKLPDFNEYQIISERKEAFFTYLKPMILDMNQEVAKDRQLLLNFADIYDKTDQLPTRYQAQLQELSHKYRVDEKLYENKPELFKTLRLRIDTLPESLVLAQAANESAWGLSRFAQEGNNLFGQWCFKEGCGIVPKRRGQGQHHEVAVFPSPKASVRSYMMNLNTHPAYESLRLLRQALEFSQKPVTGKALAAGLMNYSERKEAYVKEIRLMIEQNHLE